MPSDKTKTIVESLQQRMNAVAESTPTQEVSPLSEMRAKCFELTAGELRAACDQNSSHPKVADFLKGVRGFPNDHKVAVEMTDLQALLEGKDTVLVDSIVEDEETGGLVHVKEKRLVDLAPQSPPPESAQSESKGAMSKKSSQPHSQPGLEKGSRPE